ncbi:MAG: DUF2950 domain-containing protein [Syntrophales bacterium]
MFRNLFPDKAVPFGRLATMSMAAMFMITFTLPVSAPAASIKQRTFASPEAAVNALVTAVKEGSSKELIRILGPGSDTLVSSGDKVQDRQRRGQFAKAYDEKNRLETAGDGSVKLFIGNDDWPFPFPLVKGKQNWRFDTQAGREELFCRRIGANELSAIQVCLAIADAQDEYADLMNVMHGRPEYAQKFESSKGKKDGLYWDASPGETPSPLGPLVARARAEGYRDTVGKSAPYHGYLYRILAAQGDSANGGALGYIIGGKMIGGFAVVAFPAVYGSTGINTFIVNHEGVVYRKDLGKETTRIAMAMMTFDPDATWTKVD